MILLMPNSRFERLYAFDTVTLVTRYRLCYGDAIGIAGKG